MKKPKAKVGRILFTKEQIRDRLGLLAAEIQERYKGEELTILAVLKGSLIFTADLVRRIDIPVRMDILEISSYFDDTRPIEQTTLSNYMVGNIRGRHVLVVDDIVDTGGTLAKVLELLRRQRPKSVATCVFLNKTCRRRMVVPVDFTGFDLKTDEFVVGYGLDYAQRFRNLPYLAVLEREEKRKPVARRPRKTGNSTPLKLRGAKRRVARKRRKK